MKKVSLFVLAVFVLAALANMASAQASPAADKEVQRVGLVLAYTPGESITILDKDGNEFTFELASQIKIVPAQRADMLGVGAYVTIIAPNNVPNDKHIAVGIVIHPKAPSGFPIPTATFTPLPTETLTPTETPTSTEPLTETATATETATPTPTAESQTGTRLPQIDASAAVTAVIDWLASLFRQILSATIG